MLESLVELLGKVLSKTISYQEVLILSNLLWIYHRQVAKQRGVDTSRGGRFLKLVDQFSYVEYQRGAIDIYKDLLSNNVEVFELPVFYVESIEKLRGLLSEFLSNKKS